jgi:hypothetical protein
MRNLFKWMLPTVAAVGLVIGVASVRAADEPKKATGSITGKVVDKDGKGVEDVEVHLMQPRMGRGGGRGGAGGGAGGAGGEPAKQSTQNHDAIGLQAQGGAGGGGHGGMPKPIMTSKTDKDGKFEMKDVPVGDYMVGVRDDDKKVYGGTRVKVEEGKAAPVEIKTSDTPRRPGGGGGGGGGAGGGGKHGGARGGAGGGAGAGQ